MIYVCSDIHGNYERYEAAKKLLRPDGEDVMFIVGDMIDRGPDGIKIIQDVMQQDYIVAMAGNHEWMMYQSLVLQEEAEYANWVFPNNGGQATVNDFLMLDDKEQKEILDFISNLPVTMQLEYNGKTYYLAHGCGVKEYLDESLMNMQQLQQEDARALFEIVWNSPVTDPTKMIDYSEYGTRQTYIHGHKFVQRFQKDYTVIKYEDRDFDILMIDGGCAIRDPEQYGVTTALDVYCMDTDEVYYIC